MDVVSAIVITVYYLTEDPTMTLLATASSLLRPATSLVGRQKALVCAPFLQFSQNGSLSFSGLPNGTPPLTPRGAANGSNWSNGTAATAMSAAALTILATASTSSHTFFPSTYKEGQSSSNRCHMEAAAATTSDEEATKRTTHPVLTTSSLKRRVSFEIKYYQRSEYGAYLTTNSIVFQTLGIPFVGLPLLFCPDDINWSLFYFIGNQA